MSDNHGDDSELADAAIEEYLRLIDAGATVDRAAFIAAHADVAKELRSFFGSLSLLQKMAGPGGLNKSNHACSIGQSLHGLAGTGDSRLPWTSLPAMFGRYRVESLLGRGAMGAVFRAHDTQLDRTVALKLSNFPEDAALELKERMLHEARAAASLSHLNICRVYDVGEIEGARFIAMELIEGRSLADYIRAGRLLPPQTAVLIIRKLALAIQAAHDRGIVHRDLKPSNVIINAAREPILMDFGLAHRPIVNGEERLTKAGMLIGSPAYMSPEQVRADGTGIGPASDIYGLGVVLYELLTGKLPFSGSVMTILAKVLSEEPPSIQSVRSEINKDLSDICGKMLAKRPESRFNSMNEVAEALQLWLKSAGKTNQQNSNKPGASTTPITAPTITAIGIADSKFDDSVTATSQKADGGARKQRPLALASSAMQTTAPAASLGLLDFIWQSYSRTHGTWPLFFGVISGLLLIPLISFSKPLLGVSVITEMAIICLAFSFLLFLVLAINSAGRYLIWKRRTISENSRSRLSTIVCYLATVTPALGVIAAAENFAPAEGLFVTLLPQFKSEQFRILDRLGTVHVNPGTHSTENASIDDMVQIQEPKKASAAAEASNTGSQTPIAITGDRPGVVIKEIDGKGLSADMVTQRATEKEQASLLKKQFDGFPQSCIKATVNIGKPGASEAITEQAEITLTVQIEPDLKAYKAFVDRITPSLEKLAISKGEFTATFSKVTFLRDKSERGPSQEKEIELLAADENSFSKWIPKAFDTSNGLSYLKNDVLIIAVATNWTDAGDRIDYNVFFLDKALRPVLVDIASRSGQAKLQLFSDEGTKIATDRFPLGDKWFAGTPIASFSGDSFFRMVELGLSDRQDRAGFERAKRSELLVLVGPTFFAGPHFYHSSTYLVGRLNKPQARPLFHNSQLTISRNINLSLYELKSIKSAAVEITFND